MSFLVIALLFIVSRNVTTPFREETDEQLPAPLETAGTRTASAADDPAILGGAFVIVALLAGIAVVAAVGGLGVPESLSVSFVGVTMALFGGIIALFLFLGPYVVVRQHGLGNAYGVFAGLSGLGAAFILLLAIQLLFELV